MCYHANKLMWNDCNNFCHVFQYEQRATTLFWLDLQIYANSIISRALVYYMATEAETSDEYAQFCRTKYIHILFEREMFHI